MRNVSKFLVNTSLSAFQSFGKLKLFFYELLYGHSHFLNTAQTMFHTPNQKKDIYLNDISSRYATRIGTTNDINRDNFYFIESDSIQDYNGFVLTEISHSSNDSIAKLIPHISEENTDQDMREFPITEELINQIKLLKQTTPNNYYPFISHYRLKPGQTMYKFLYIDDIIYRKELGYNIKLILGINFHKKEDIFLNDKLALNDMETLLGDIFHHKLWEKNKFTKLIQKQPKLLTFGKRIPNGLIPTLSKKLQRQLTTLFANPFLYQEKPEIICVWPKEIYRCQYLKEPILQLPQIQTIKKKKPTAFIKSAYDTRPITGRPLYTSAEKIFSIWYNTQYQINPRFKFKLLRRHNNINNFQSHLGLLWLNELNRKNTLPLPPITKAFKLAWNRRIGKLREKKLYVDGTSVSRKNLKHRFIKYGIVNYMEELTSYELKLGHLSKDMWLNHLSLTLIPPNYLQFPTLSNGLRITQLTDSQIYSLNTKYTYDNWNHHTKTGKTVVKITPNPQHPNINIHNIKDIVTQTINLKGGDFYQEIIRCTIHRYIHKQICRTLSLGYQVYKVHTDRLYSNFNINELEKSTPISLAGNPTQQQLLTKLHISDIRRWTEEEIDELKIFDSQKLIYVTKANRVKVKGFETDKKASIMDTLTQQSSFDSTTQSKLDCIQLSELELNKSNYRYHLCPKNGLPIESVPLYTTESPHLSVKLQFTEKTYIIPIIVKGIKTPLHELHPNIHFKNVTIELTQDLYKILKEYSPTRELLQDNFDPTQFDDPKKDYIKEIHNAILAVSDGINPDHPTSRLQFIKSNTKERVYMNPSQIFDFYGINTKIGHMGYGPLHYQIDKLEIYQIYWNSLVYYSLKTEEFMQDVLKIEVEKGIYEFRELNYHNLLDLDQSHNNTSDSDDEEEDSDDEEED